MNRLLFYVFAAIFVMAGMLYSCHGDGGSTGFIPTTGTVAVYATDTPVSGVFSQVTATITKVQLVNTGTNTSCDLLPKPILLNIANLADTLQLVNVTECVPGSFNRFRIQFDKNAQLVSASTGTSTSCVFSSFKNEGSGTQPNVLHCDSVTDICTLDVNGAVDVLSLKDNKLALDFDLKNFDVQVAETACSMTMKVSPLTPSDIRTLSRAEAVTGLVSRLSITNQTFDLTRGNRTFSVLYSGITNSAQPGLDTLLGRAQDDRLRTRVTTSTIDLSNNRIAATRIEVKVEGTVSGLVPDSTFTVNYNTGGVAKTIGVDFSGVAVSGIIEKGLWVDVKLTGHDQASGNFIADKVEVEPFGTMTED